MKCKCGNGLFPGLKQLAAVGLRKGADLTSPLNGPNILQRSLFLPWVYMYVKATPDSSVTADHILKCYRVQSASEWTGYLHVFLLKKMCSVASHREYPVSMTITSFLTNCERVESTVPLSHMLIPVPTVHMPFPTACCFVSLGSIRPAHLPVLKYPQSVTFP
jgi:hypothetical protein